MERQQPPMGDPQLPFGDPTPGNEFVGISDPQFLDFMTQAKPKIAKYGEEVAIVDTMNQMVDILYPDLDPRYIRHTAESMRNKLSVLSRIGLMPLSKAVDKSGRTVRITTTEDGMINALSFLYAKKELDMPASTSSKLVTNAALNRMANLWGENPRSEVYKMAVKNIVTPSKADDENPDNSYSDSPNQERREREQAHIESTLKKIPLADNRFAEFTVEKINEVIARIDKEFPRWRLESGELMLDRFPIPESVIQAARFVFANESGRLQQFKLSQEPVAVSVVVQALKAVKVLIPRYEELYRKRYQNTNNNIKLDLSVIYNINVAKVRRNLGFDKYKPQK